MTTMNVSLPAPMKDYVDARVAEAAYGSSSEYIRELIRHDQARQRLRSLILDGASSSISGEATTDFFEGLRRQVAS